MNRQHWITLTLLLTAITTSQSQPSFPDVVYSSPSEKNLKLDIYLPVGTTKPSLVIWVHGGAWQSGTKANPPKAFVDAGFAMASIDFRQSTEARFPAQIHDIKAAVRFLRANAAKYGYQADRIAIAGSSSGGHLALLAGVTNGNKELEGNGGNPEQSSDIQAIIDYYGASNLTTILSQSTPHGLGVRKPALDLLLGGQPDSLKTIARLASPVFQIDQNDPPLFILHGDQDPQMPVNQSLEIEGQYKKLKLDVQLDIVYGAAHGGNEFFSGEHLEKVVAFLKRIMGE
jgi:acetyl esterase/lipase